MKLLDLLKTSVTGICWLALTDTIDTGSIELIIQDGIYLDVCKDMTIHSIDSIPKDVDNLLRFTPTEDWREL